MATLAYPFEVRDSANTTTDNRKTGLTATVAAGKTLASTPAVVLASTVSVVEVGFGIYVALYDAVANLDASFPVDWGVALTNPNDRYGSLILTRDAGLILGSLTATGATLAAGSIAAATFTSPITIPDARLANLDAAVSAAAQPGLFTPGTISTVTSASSFVVAFTGSAPLAALLHNLYCCLTSATHAPGKLPIDTATVVDATHLTLTFLTPFGVAPTVGDTVEIG
jgi:hypothetical protein